MKRIMFAGACDKRDLLLYICKVLASAEQRLLLVDATLAQDYRYAVAALDERCPVAQYEGFDVAVGFLNETALDAYLSEQGETLDDYELILIDSDSPDIAAGWKGISGRVLVTNYEKATIAKNVELMSRMLEHGRREAQEQVIQVFLQTVECGIDEAYIESTMSKLPIAWAQPAYAISYDEIDLSTKIDNQFYGRLRLKPLSLPYKKTIVGLSQSISGLDGRAIKEAFKRAERRA